MHWIFTTLATALLLLGTGTTSLHAADEEEKEKDTPAQLIRWTDSIYGGGNKFMVTAGIFPDRVELHWDGFAGDAMEFTPDRKLKTPERVTKDYLFTDKGTVEAFRTLAIEAEQCNPGLSGDNGMSTEVVVEMPSGKQMQRMRSYARPPQVLKANRFGAIPFLVKDLVRGPTPREVPEENFFSRNLRDFAGDLSRSAVCLGKLESAYQARGELPLVDLEALRVPLTVGRALSIEGYKPGAAKSTVDLLATVEAVLADGLGPVHRAAFVSAGEEWGEGGILLAVEKANFVYREVPHQCRSGSARRNRRL